MQPFLHASSCLPQLFKGSGGSWTLEHATSRLLQLMLQLSSWAMEAIRDELPATVCGTMGVHALAAGAAGCAMPRPAVL